MFPASCTALREAVSGAAHIPLRAVVTWPGLEQSVSTSCWLFFPLHQHGSWLFAIATPIQDLPASDGSSWSLVSLRCGGRWRRVSERDRERDDQKKKK